MSEISSNKFDFGHPQFLRKRGPLTYFETSKATVLAGDVLTGVMRQLCQITFHRGSIFVQFTYFGDGPGLVGAIRPVRNERGFWEIRFAEKGVVAPAMVKYSHPPDGRAHFSQDGRMLTKVWRQSFPLSTGRGHIFELHAYHPRQFAELRPESQRKNRLYLPFVFEKGLPEALGLVGMWWPLDELEQMIVTAKAANAGPVTTLFNRRTGHQFVATFVAPSSGEPPNRVLVLNVGPVELPKGSKESMIYFMGGWDPDVENADPTTGSLAFMYPLSDPDKWAEKLGSLMLPPRTNP